MEKTSLKGADFFVLFQLISIISTSFFVCMCTMVYSLLHIVYTLSIDCYPNGHGNGCIIFWGVMLSFLVLTLLTTETQPGLEMI